MVSSMEWAERAAVLRPLLHLMLPFFIHITGAVVAFPAITDVTVNALCGEGVPSCSLVIYVSGLTSTVSGLGTMVLTPIMGSLSDEYGRRPLLILCTALSSIPFGILAFSTSRKAVIAYFIVRSILNMVTDGASTCLILAYVADVISVEKRTAAFGAVMAALSVGLMVGTSVSRLAPTSYVFEIALASNIIALVYFILFLPETAPSCVRIPASLVPTSEREVPAGSGPTPVKGEELQEHLPHGKPSVWKRNYSQLSATVSLIRQSPMLMQLALLGFCSNFGESGVHAGLFFYLKAQFGFEKDQFAELLLILGIAAMLSQVALLPFFVHFLGVRWALLTGLFFAAVHGVLYGVAWASWVPYAAAACAAFSCFVFPAVGSIVSAMGKAEEQGKLQGVLSGVRSLAGALAPLIFNPLLAYFMSDSAPFKLPSFGILVATLFTVLAFGIACKLPPIPSRRSEDSEQEFMIVPSEALEDGVLPGGLAQPLLPAEADQLIP